MKTTPLSLSYLDREEAEVAVGVQVAVGVPSLESSLVAKSKVEIKYISQKPQHMLGLLSFCRTQLESSAFAKHFNLSWRLLTFAHSEHPAQTRLPNCRIWPIYHGRQVYQLFVGAAVYRTIGQYCGLW